MVASILRSPRRQSRLLAATSLTGLAVIAFAARPSAHPIPESVTIQVAAKAEGQKLRILIQMPVAAMRDINFPLLDGGEYLDLSKLDSALRTAAETWLAPVLPVFEGGSALAQPAVAGIRLDLPSDRSFSSYEQAIAHTREPPLKRGTSHPARAR